jgi:sugar/nucleoside kinase (ribokinase family)
MSLDVVTLGPLNVDLLITGTAPTNLDELTQWMGQSQVTLTAAGSNGYTTLALARLGLKAGVVAVLADDAFGNMVLQTVKQAGVEVSRVQRQANTLSGIGIYILLFGNKKRPLTYRLPTHQPWPRRLSQADREYLLSGRHVHCGGYLHFPEMWNDDLAEVFHLAHERGLSTSLDPQGLLYPYDGSWLEPIRDALRYTDMLLLDAQEARRIAQLEDLPSVAMALKQIGPRLVAIKDGTAGTLICLEDRMFRQPAAIVPEDEIVETVGAGDTFDAALIAAFLAGWPIERCASFAALAAASSVRGAGAVTSLLSWEELERMSGAE